MLNRIALLTALFAATTAGADPLMTKEVAKSEASLEVVEHTSPIADDGITLDGWLESVEAASALEPVRGEELGGDGGVQEMGVLVCLGDDGVSNCHELESYTDCAEYFAVEIGFGTCYDIT